MRMYVLYHNPKDYPGKYVARGCTIIDGGVIMDHEPLIVTGDCAEARAMIRRQDHNLVVFNRDPKDDPVIVETWL